jgi:hypothetical protein
VSKSSSCPPEQALVIGFGVYFEGIGLPAQKLPHTRIFAVSYFFGIAFYHDRAPVHNNNPICYFEGALKFMGDY